MLHFYWLVSSYMWWQHSHWEMVILKFWHCQNVSIAENICNGNVVTRPWQLSCLNFFQSATYCRSTIQKPRPKKTPWLFGPLSPGTARNRTLYMGPYPQRDSVGAGFILIRQRSQVWPLAFKFTWTKTHFLLILNCPTNQGLILNKNGVSAKQMKPFFALRIRLLQNTCLLQTRQPSLSEQVRAYTPAGKRFGRNWIFILQGILIKGYSSKLLLRLT